MIYFFLERHMENQINIEDQNTQQIGQNPVNQPIQIPEKPKINYWMVSTTLLFIVLLTSGGWFVLNSKNKTSSQRKQSTTVQTNQMVTTGVIRTSGLSEEEKQKFGLTTVNYQVTDFGDYQRAYQEGQIMGYFLLSSNVNDELLGKCVRLSGVIPEEWKNKIKADVYNRSVLNVASIEKIDNSSCNPYVQSQLTVDNTQEKLVLRGTAVHTKRPAPDIGYDYQLKLVEPFTDKLNASGLGPQPQSTVDIIPPTNVIWIDLEENINKEIGVEGYMVWGYAESRYLLVISVNNENDHPEKAANSTQSALSYGLFYPYTNGITINNSKPTIIGKVSQSGQSYLSTKFGLEKSPASQADEYFLRFTPGKVKNLEVKIDSFVIPDVFGIAQYPTVLCKKIDLNPNGDDIFTSESECFAQKSADIPPLIFFARSTNHLSPGKHTLAISSFGKIIGSMSFTLDNNFKLPVQTIAKPNQTDYFSYLDTADNCMGGYYYDNNYLKIPLPTDNNQNLFYGVSFPQTNEEHGSIKRRKVQIGFEGHRFDLFFPPSKVYYDGKSFKKENALIPEKALFLPKDRLFFTDGNKATPQKLLVAGGLIDGEYFEIYPLDTSGYEYRGYSLPWQTSSSSGCDG